MKRPQAGAYDPLMTVEFGLALENFTPEAKVPDVDAISAYSIAAEELGRASVWAWDHLFLGARRPFPFLEALGLRYKAGAMGVPFLPSLTMLGSDLAARLDLQTVTCPYTGERLAAVPALNPDVALIHAHRADMFGNVQVDGYQHMDVDMARAARTVIVSAEQIVSPGEIAAGRP
jgi:hypothetical protein